MRSRLHYCPIRFHPKRRTTHVAAMSWLKVLIGFLIAVGILVAWHRVMKAVRGSDSGGLDAPVRARRRGRDPQEPNELEQIIARHRSSAQGEAGKPASPPKLTLVASNPPDAVASPQRPPALLHGAGKVAFLAFKTALPECHVLARVSLAQLAPADPAGEELGQHALAVVICRADFSVIAAADVSDGTAESRLASVGRVLESRAIRHLILDPREMPKPKEIRALLQA